MAPEQHKVSLISEFLEQSFVGCSVRCHEDEDHVAQVYQIVNETTGELLHRVIVSRGFLHDHAEAEIVPALQNLWFLVCLEMAGRRRVFVRSQMIEIEQNRLAA